MPFAAVGSKPAIAAAESRLAGAAGRVGGHGSLVAVVMVMMVLVELLSYLALSAEVAAEHHADRKADQDEAEPVPVEGVVVVPIVRVAVVGQLNRLYGLALNHIFKIN
eukprot:CAMPEP_0170461932 /NCGR_PEP_ID=MMETSP0123-20130129/7639_1 /TAXON_ID=182087 /ORGANISM="Favella ehrenbergii, Strain Fehren 1" /LENGTH=107 /DNA_ID=CAMNT_0010727049 /DNA_START=250 /DNA_END=571 /DNA_ORIENTATION=+